MQSVANISLSAGRWIVATLCIGIALFSYRYVASIGPLAPNVMANALVAPWLALHVAGAATALMIAPFQFIARFRARRSGVHRLLGRVYVIGCMVGGASGFLLALGSSSGPVATVGFGGLAIFWLVTTGQGWRSAVARRFAAHREWMIRSFALTLAAVTLRLYLPLPGLLGIDPLDGYRAISILCWAPNLLLAEVWIRRTRAQSARIASSASASASISN